MNIFQIIFLIVCGIGTLNSILFGFYLLFEKKGIRHLNILLAVFIFSFSIRVSKSIWLLFFSFIHPVYEIIWYVCFASIPFVFASYLIMMTNQLFIFYKQIRFLIPGLTAFLIALMFFKGNETATFTLAMILYLFIFIYTVIIFAGFVNKKAEPNKQTKKWISFLTLFTGAIWLLYTTIYIHNRYVFLTEAVLFSAAIYAVVFVEIRYSLISFIHKEYKETFLPDEKVQSQLVFLMEKEKVFLNPNLSLPSLSKTLGTTPHYLSKLINAAYSMNFNDYINSYRINEAKIKLSDETKANRKISALAFECGFNSISVFNAAFKKFTETTPSKYQIKAVKSLNQSQNLTEL